MALATKTLLKPYVALHKLRTDLETKLADVKTRMKDLEPALTDSFTGEGLQSVNCNGYTVYLHRQLWAGHAGDKDALMAELKAMTDESWSFLVKDNINSNSFSARVRELERNEDDMPILPDNLKSLIKVSEVFKIGMRKSG